MKNQSFKPGDKVTFRVTGISEQGIVKSLCQDPKYVYVVFNCGQDWGNYQNYTAEMTPISLLSQGWNKKQVN